VRGSASPARLAGAVGAALADPHIDAVLALHVARPAFGAIDSARAVADAARQSTKPVFGAWLGALDRREVDAALEAGTVANFYTPENAVEAFSFLAAYRRNQAWLLEVPPPQALPEVPDLARAEQIRQRALHMAETRLPAADVYALLAAFGIDTPPFAIVETLGEAAAAAKRMRFPVTLVLETDTPGAAPSQRAVRSRNALAKAWGELHLATPKGVRTVRGAHAFVRRGISSGRGRTFAIAVAQDRVFGPVIMLRPDTAAGGAAWALMLPPLNRDLPRTWSPKPAVDAAPALDANAQMRSAAARADAGVNADMRAALGALARARSCRGQRGPCAGTRGAHRRRSAEIAVARLSSHGDPSVPHRAHGCRPVARRDEACRPPDTAGRR
jgi:acetyltransferase